MRFCFLDGSIGVQGKVGVKGGINRLGIILFGSIRDVRLVIMDDVLSSIHTGHHSCPLFDANVLPAITTINVLCCRCLQRSLASLFGLPLTFFPLACGIFSGFNTNCAPPMVHRNHHQMFQWTHVQTECSLGWWRQSGVWAR